MGSLDCYRGAGIPQSLSSCSLNHFKLQSLKNPKISLQRKLILKRLKTIPPTSRCTAPAPSVPPLSRPAARPAVLAVLYVPSLSATNLLLHASLLTQLTVMPQLDLLVFLSPDNTPTTAAVTIPIQPRGQGLEKHDMMADVEIWRWFHFMNMFLTEIGWA